MLDADGKRVFQVALSVEKDSAAHSTLRLRAFLRQFDGDFPEAYYEYINNGVVEPDWAKLFPEQWSSAEQEAQQLELGNEQHTDILNARIDAIRALSKEGAILIGGPPCQAYSLVGRSRNAGVRGYLPNKDKRHFLYEEYIRIIDRLRPVAFVMENVKGLLSSSVDGESLIFDKVLQDLRGLERGGEEYEILALAPRNRRQKGRANFNNAAEDFVIRSEDFGIPQARHRVLIATEN